MLEAGRTFATSLALAIAMIGCGSPPTPSPTPSPSPVPSTTASPLPSGAATGTWLATWFGAPFLRLPADQREQLERRFDAAVGDTLDLLSADARLARVQALSASGYTRLDGRTLVEYLRLYAAAFEATDIATCAETALAGEYGTGPSLGVDAALASLDTSSYGRWMEIQVEAIEAELKGSVPRPSVAQEDLSRIDDEVLRKLSAAEITALWPNDPSAPLPPNAAACAAYRHYLGGVLEIAPVDLERYALAMVGADITPSPTPAATPQVDPTSDLKIAPPYTIAGDDPTITAMLRAGMEASLGSMAGSIPMGMRYVNRGDAVAGLVMVLQFPDGALADAPTFLDSVTGSLGSDVTKVKILGQQVRLGKSQGQFAAVAKHDQGVLMVFAPTKKAAKALMTALIKANT